MTAVIVSLTHQAGAGRAPSAGRLSWKPTQRRVDGSVVILPAGSSLNLPAGTGTVDLDPGVYWFVEDVNGGESAYRIVPDGGPVNYSDLAAVDPATLASTAVPDAAWWAALEQAQLGVHAVPDPDDPDVLILSYPSNQADPADPSIIIVPVYEQESL